MMIKCRILTVFLSVVVLLAVYSCERKTKERPRKSPRIKKCVSVVSPKPNATVAIGDSLLIALKSNKKTKRIDSVAVKIGSQAKAKSIGATKNVLVSNQMVGTKSIKITAFLSDGTKEHLRQNMTVVSDLVPVNYTFRKINTFAHDPDDFTQGLLIDQGVMYENTGHYGQSVLKKLNWQTREVLQSINLGDQYFGEGIATLNDKIYQLTWREREGFVYDKNTLEKVGSFHYSQEGWGLTAKEDTLLMSDGSNLIYFMDSGSFQEVKKIQVYDNKGAIDLLNELEFINGKIWANRYETDLIYIIDPDTGKVEGVIDLSGIFNRDNYDKRIDVLNGIAYDKDTQKIYVTGKWWPKLFEIEIMEKPTNNI